MELRLSEYARKRQQQRGFSTLSLQILSQFAREKNVAGNAAFLFLGRKEAMKAAREFKRCLQALDKVRGSSMVIDDGQILTLKKV